MTLLKLEKICKKFGDTHILNEVSFELKVGESLAIMGRSGSGKSTLLNIIAGLTQPDSGRIFFDNHEITRLNEDALTLIRGEKMGFVFQTFKLLEALTILENVCLPLEILNQPHVIQQALTWLDKVGLKEKSQELPSILSGGEQQRIALARALIHHPKLLLADEPTGNLDYKTSEMITQMMISHTQSTNTTLLIATHDRDLAKKADRVVELYQGTLRNVTLPK